MKQRIITAVILGIIFIPAALYSLKTAKVLYIVLMLAMAFEYLKAAYATDSDGFPKLFLGILGAVGLLFSLYYFEPTVNVQLFTFGIVVIFILLNIILLLKSKTVLLTKGPYFLLVQLYITLPILLLIYSLDNIPDLHLIIFGVILLIWLSDVGAYFSGKFLGKHKLFPEVSPNKTWEGFFGGGLAVLIGASLISFYPFQYTLVQWLIIGVIVWLFGSVGDLVESAFKRYFRLKDSGTMLPGHGGFLDRFDSFIFVVPVVLAFFYFIS